MPNVHARPLPRSRHFTPTFPLARTEYFRSTPYPSGVIRLDPSDLLQSGPLRENGRGQCGWRPEAAVAPQLHRLVQPSRRKGPGGPAAGAVAGGAGVAADTAATEEATGQCRRPLLRGCASSNGGLVLRMRRRRQSWVALPTQSRCGHRRRAATPSTRLRDGCQSSSSTSSTSVRQPSPPSMSRRWLGAWVLRQLCRLTATKT